MPEEQTKKTSTRRFTLTAAGLAACLAVIPSVINAIRGEPVAEQTWKTLKEQVDKQSEVINRIHVRMAYFQAKEESRTAMQIQKQLEDLQEKYNNEVAAKKAEQCKEGHAPGTDGKCHWVKKAVAAKVKEVKSETKHLKEKLIEEQKRRKDLEMKRYNMGEQMPQKILKALPARPMDS